MKRNWPAPGVKLPDMTEDQLDILMIRLDQLETEFSAPFLNNKEPDLEPIAKTPAKKTPAKKKAAKK